MALLTERTDDQRSDSGAGWRPRWKRL